MKNSNFIEIPEHIQRAMSFDEGYFSVPLQESRDQFIYLPAFLKEHGVHATFDDHVAGGETKSYWVRSGLGKPLLNVADTLKKHNLFLHVEYAYRSFEQQKAIFEFYVEKTIKDYPQADKASILKMAGVYAACNPATAAHMGGAAIDVTLRDQHHQPVDLGAEYLDNSPQAETFASLLPKVIKARRKLLVSAMEAAGFANYPFEFWHFSYGDRIAAYIQHKPFAVYGPVKFAAQQGVTHFFSDEEQQRVFDVDQLFSRPERGGK